MNFAVCEAVSGSSWSSHLGRLDAHFGVANFFEMTSAYICNTSAIQHLLCSFQSCQPRNPKARLITYRFTESDQLHEVKRIEIITSNFDWSARDRGFSIVRC